MNRSVILEKSVKGIVTATVKQAICERYESGLVFFSMDTWTW